MTGSRDLRFRESRYTHFYHDLRIYICGVDVSEHIKGTVSVSISDSAAPNTATVILDNALENFTFNAKNAEGSYGGDGYGRYSEVAKRLIVERKLAKDGKPTIQDYQNTVTEALNSPQTGNLKEIYDQISRGKTKFADGTVKNQVLRGVDKTVKSLFKDFFSSAINDVTRQSILDEVAKKFPGLDTLDVERQYEKSKSESGAGRSAESYTTLPIESSARIQVKQDSDNNNPKTEDGTRLYSFDVGDLVIGKHDPILIYAHNPLSEKDEWYPAFTGFINTINDRIDERTGESTLTVQCYCIRSILKQMRIAENPSYARIVPYLIFDNIGFFNDYVDANTDAWTTFLVGWSLEQVVCNLITGNFSSLLDYEGAGKTAAIEGKSFKKKGQVGRFSIGEIVRYPEGRASTAMEITNRAMEKIEKEKAEAKAALLNERANKNTTASGTSAGTSTVDSTPAPNDGTQSSLIGIPTSSATNAAKAVLDYWHTISVFGGSVVFPGADGKDETIHSIGDTFYTEEQVRKIGENSYIGGPYDPWSRSVHFLLPDSGTNVNWLSSYAPADNPSQLTFTNRWDIIRKHASTLDYQFYTSPNGDLLLEFPVYDFSPEDFGPNYAPLFTYLEHLIDSSVTPETDSVPAGVVFTGTLLASVAGTNDEFTQQVIRRVMAYSPVIAAKYGVNDIAYESAPFLDDIERLKAYAAVHYQKMLADASSLSFSATHRPFLMPNRPILHERRGRLGISKSVEHTWEIGGVVTTDVALKAIRKRIKTDKGTIYRFATGGTRLAVSYRFPVQTNKIPNQKTKEASPSVLSPQNNQTGKAPDEPKTTPDKKAKPTAENKAAAQDKSKKEQKSDKPAESARADGRNPRTLSNVTVWVRSEKNPSDPKKSKQEIIEMIEIEDKKDRFLEKDAAEWWFKMVDAAKADGVTLNAKSAWRPTFDEDAMGYDVQSQTFLYNAWKDGLEKTITLSDGSEKKVKYNKASQPKTSNHEAGRSVDVLQISGTGLTSDQIDNRMKRKEYVWLKNNASKYKFENDVYKSRPKGDFQEDGNEYGYEKDKKGNYILKNGQKSPVVLRDEREPWHWTFKGKGPPPKTEVAAETEKKSSPPQEETIDQTVQGDNSGIVIISSDSKSKSTSTPAADPRKPPAT